MNIWIQGKFWLPTSLTLFLGDEIDVETVLVKKQLTSQTKDSRKMLVHNSLERKRRGNLATGYHNLESIAKEVLDHPVSKFDLLLF